MDICGQFRRHALVCSFSLPRFACLVLSLSAKCSFCKHIIPTDVVCKMQGVGCDSAGPTGHVLCHDCMVAARNIGLIQRQRRPRHGPSEPNTNETNSATATPTWHDTFLGLATRLQGVICRGCNVTFFRTGRLTVPLAEAALQLKQLRLRGKVVPDATLVKVEVCAMFGSEAPVFSCSVETATRKDKERASGGQG